jgi:outer membrane receptor protein involved in Fe transport
LNDPFGGWVRWNRFSLSDLEAVRFGRKGAFASSAGSITLQSRRPTDKPIHHLGLAGGDVHGFSVHGFTATTTSEEDWEATAGFRMEDYAGHPVIRASQRGLVDENAWSRMQAARATASHSSLFGRFTMSFAGFDEHRGNGTPLGRNQGHGLDWSLGLENEGSRTILFGQERGFGSVFTKVEKDRDSESVALDQFSVPGSSLGFIHAGSRETGEHEVSFAFVALRREGETNENFAGYKFRRVAGGRQTQLGLSLSDAWSPAEGWNLVANLRGDWFRDDQGRHKKWRLSNDAVLEDHSFVAREDFEAGGLLQLSRELTPQLAVRATVRSHVRQPTLNELYRPYRVGAFKVAANENLVTERITGTEVGLDWSPSEACSISLTLFQDYLRDSVANVSDPAPPYDAQRINLNQARSKGLELSLEYLLANDFNIELKSLLVDTEVRRCPENTSIVGNRFAQAPNHRSTASFSWTPSSWEFRLDARHESNRYDDALNSRLLDNCLNLDVSLSRIFSKNTRIFLTVNNITNEEIQTHRSAEGLVYVEAPRNWSAGLDWKF